MTDLKLGPCSFYERCHNNASYLCMVGVNTVRMCGICAAKYSGPQLRVDQLPAFFEAGVAVFFSWCYGSRLALLSAMTDLAKCLGLQGEQRTLEAFPAKDPPALAWDPNEPPRSKP